ncbi:MAG: HPP family protein [Dehalococcoidia bacterium]|tara:strand:- start:9923 stop:10426 length:504 start_codon:yes stop_codon:yes gene_type:complete
MGSFHIANPNIRGHWGRYLAQSVLAVFAMLVVLLFIDSVANAALVAGLGSTVVTAFLHPQASSGRLRAIIGGHSCGLIVGSILALVFINYELVIITFAYGDILVMAGAVGLTILAMGLTDTEHPPAAGIALGMAGRPWELNIFVYILIAVLILGIIRFIFNKLIKEI